MEAHEGLGNMPRFSDLREIFPSQKREWRKHRKDVGEELRRGERKEEENEECPNDEVEEDRVCSPFP